MTEISQRYAKVDRSLRVAIELMGTRTGLSITDIMALEEPPMSRKTAERVRDALLRAFPGMRSRTDEDRVKRWWIASAPLSRLAPSLDELAALALAAQMQQAAGLSTQAAVLEALRARLASAAKDLPRIEPDLELLLESEGFAMRPGPREEIPPHAFRAIRQAILSSCVLHFTYEGRDSRKVSRQTQQPYGLLFGSRAYLVSWSPAAEDYRLWALSHMSDITVGDEAFVRDPSFSLNAFAERSFGVFQEEPVDVEVHFVRGAIRDARRFRFHPSQTMEEREDRLVVRFRAGGLREMYWHFIQWMPDIEVVAPDELRGLLHDAV